MMDFEVLIAQLKATDDPLAKEALRWLLDQEKLMEERDELIESRNYFKSRCTMKPMDRAPKDGRYILGVYKQRSKHYEKYCDVIYWYQEKRPSYSNEYDGWHGSDGLPCPELVGWYNLPTHFYHENGEFKV